MAIGTTFKEDAAAGLGHAGAAIDAANAGLGAAQGFAGQMTSDAGRMRAEARLVNTEAGKVGAQADALQELIPQLDPYKATLTDYGDRLSSLASSYETESKDALGQGRALATLDRSAGGLAGEYMAQYDLLSPDRYVSRAASDVQRSYDNAEAQQGRALARQGVSAGSGAALSLADQFARAKAVALAAAKTSARQTGIDERGKWLAQITGAADTMYNWGLRQGEAARGALGTAGDMQKGAAGMVAQQGDMTKDVAALRSEVANLHAKAAGIFGSAAGVTGDAARITESAYEALRSAQTAAANYYQGVMGLGMRGGGGGGGASVQSSQGSPDIWERTGHSETWWHNNDPEMHDQLTLMAAAQE